MPLFFKKPTADREEAEGCAVCIYAQVGEEGGVFCLKRRKPVEETFRCAAYEYDLLKHRPAGRKTGASIIEEFEQVMEEEKKRS